jgi:hypothetical protein
MPLLTLEQVQAAHDISSELPEKMGVARAKVIETKDKKEQEEARLILASLETSEGKRKAWAKSHPDYIRACKEHAEAEGIWARLQQTQTHCTMVLELYRTESANERGISRRYG